MLQIVGTWCSVCRERITSESGAVFCETCGGPHHIACQALGANIERCSTCGGDRSHPFALKNQELRATASWVEARQLEAKAAKAPGVRLFTILFALIGIAIYQILQAAFFPQREAGYDFIRILLAAFVGAVCGGFGPMIYRAILRQQPPPENDDAQQHQDRPQSETSSD